MIHYLCGFAGVMFGGDLEGDTKKLILIILFGIVFCYVIEISLAIYNYKNNTIYKEKGISLSRLIITGIITATIMIVISGLFIHLLLPGVCQYLIEYIFGKKF